jgi:uncharacterized spore protein YtfJ
MAESYVKTFLDELSKMISSDSIVGEPIVQEDKVLIPVTKLTVGLGSGSGGTKQGDGGTGEGGGGGGAIEPVAVIAVFKDIPGPEGVQVLQLKAPSRVPEIIEKAVGAISKMKEKQPAESVEETTED